LCWFLDAGNDETVRALRGAHLGEGDFLRAGAGASVPRVSREDHQDQSDNNK
jgi:hypothetical protein